MSEKKVAISLAIGERIRKKRKELGFTLQELAKTSGLSASFISQAERNKTVPSVVSLIALAEAFEVPIGYFMEVPSSPNPIHRASEPCFIKIGSPVTYIQLSTQLDLRQNMDAILMKIPPGHDFPTDQRDGEDFLIVQEGQLDVQLGDEKATLYQGDSMHFDSRIPHSATNSSDKEVVLLYVGTPSILSAKKN